MAGHVTMLGGIKAAIPDGLTVQEIAERSEASEVRVLDPSVEEEIKQLIDQTKRNGGYDWWRRRSSNRGVSPLV